MRMSYPFVGDLCMKFADPCSQDVSTWILESQLQLDPFMYLVPAYLHIWTDILLLVNNRKKHGLTVYESCETNVIMKQVTLRGADVEIVGCWTCFELGILVLLEEKCICLQYYKDVTTSTIQISIC